MPDENEICDLLERYAAAWVGGDVKALPTFYHEKFTLHYFGNHALAGIHTGKLAALQTLAAFSMRTKRKLVEIVSIMAGAERGALLVRERFGENADAFEAERLLVYTVRDGLFAACWVYDQDQSRLDLLIGESG